MKEKIIKSKSNPFGLGNFKNNVTGNYLSDEVFKFNIPVISKEEEEARRVKWIEDRRLLDEKKIECANVFLGRSDEGIDHRCWYISYYYLATGMEGIPDTRPEELVCAESVDHATYKYHLKHFPSINEKSFEEWMNLSESHRTWGLTIKEQ